MTTGTHGHSYILFSFSCQLTFLSELLGTQAVSVSFSVTVCFAAIKTVDKDSSYFSDSGEQ